MDIRLSDYDDVVHAIYEAALAPVRRPDVTMAIAGICRASRALLFTWTAPETGGGFAFTHNVSQAALERWAAQSRHEDPFFRAGAAAGRLTEGSVMTGDELISLDELFATRFYAELWAPFDIARLCTGIVFDGTDARRLPTALSLYRSLRDPPFDGDTVDVTRRLVAHLSRALGVMFHLRDRELQVASSLAALDRLDGGVALLDRGRRVTFVNHAASVLFARGDTVVEERGEGGRRLCLQPRLRRQEAAFQAALGRALAPVAEDATDHFSRALLLAGSDSRPATVVHAAPLAPANDFSAHGAEARAIVFLYDLQSARQVRPELLCELFGMTGAEARAALQLMQGGSSKEMARHLGISVNTFRTQLAAAYAKSNTHRQADLLKLLLALPSR
ncbi:MAG: hypothetical protein ABI641_05400 [Caldimonas sp.]